MTYHETNLVWMDLEMTGLNPDQDKIIEIACIVTDCQLNVLAEGPDIVVHQTDSVLNTMDEWCVTHHGASGLTQKVRESTVSERQAEQEILNFLKQYVPQGFSPLCGNTIYQDRRFLLRHMQELEKYFHYRLLDVSTLKILANLWRPDLTEGYKKGLAHRAMEDIRESIQELKLYRDHFLRLKAE